MAGAELDKEGTPEESSTSSSNSSLPLRIGQQCALKVAHRPCAGVPQPSAEVWGAEKLSQQLSKEYGRISALVDGSPAAGAVIEPLCCGALTTVVRHPTVALWQHLQQQL
eukprot:gene2349-2656_t